MNKKHYIEIKPIPESEQQAHVEDLESHIEELVAKDEMRTLTLPPTASGVIVQVGVTRDEIWCRELPDGGVPGPWVVMTYRSEA